MSVREGSSTTGYCTPSHVATYLEQYDSFDATTDPTKGEIDRMILRKSAEIDRRTGHAWRERTVENETHTLTGPYYYWAGTPIKLMHREIVHPFDAAKGDTIEFWDGNRWEDWVADSTQKEGRDGDYWVDGPQGQLYVYRRSWWFERYKVLRVTYRYGSNGIPYDIEEACAKMVASELLASDAYGVTIPGGDSSGPSIDSTLDRWEEQINRTIETRKEIRPI